MAETADRYGLAREFAFGARNAKVLHDTVRPYWASDGSCFAYRRLTKDGVEHLLVDPRAATRRPLFDAEKLLAALAAATGADAPAIDALQDVTPEPGGAGFSFSHGGRRWRAEADDHALTDIGAAQGLGEAVAPDRRSMIALDGPNLVLVDSAGERTALTTDGVEGCGYGDFGDFVGIVSRRMLGALNDPAVIWAPDSSAIAVTRTDLRGLPQLHLVQAAPPGGGLRPQLHSYAYPMPGDGVAATLDLCFIDRAGKQVRARLDLQTTGFNPLGVRQGWWEADSRHFLLIQASQHADEVKLWRIDTRTGEATLLVSETGPGAGRPPLVEGYAVRRLSDGRVIWWSQVAGWGHLHMIEPGKPGEMRSITSGDWRVRSILHVDEGRGEILFTASGREPGIDPYYVQLYRVGLDGSGLKRLTPEDLNHDPTLPVDPMTAARMARFIGYGAGASGVSPDGQFFVDSFSAVDRPAVSVLRDRDGALVLELESADASGAWPAAVPLPEPFRVTALDGKTGLWGVIFRPPNFDPAKAYPVVEVVYGGPQLAATPKSFGQGLIGATAEQIAGLGYVTVVIDGPGTPLRSREFEFRSYGRIESCGGLDDHVAAIEALAAERPWMDISGGVAITGQSGGGYATARALAAFPDFYKVGVSLCGNHDQGAYLALWGDTFQGPHSDELYATQANHTVAANITGKLFLIHGEMDDNVHPAHTLKLVDVLIAADKDFDMLIVPNATHGVGMIPYVQRRTWDYLLQHHPVSGADA